VAVEIMTAKNKPGLSLPAWLASRKKRPPPASCRPTDWPNPLAKRLGRRGKGEQSAPHEPNLPVDLRPASLGQSILFDSEMKRALALPFWVFVLLWFAALLLPFGAVILSPVAGALVGVLLASLWVSRMPTGCIGGAFVAFPMTVLQIASGLGWLVFGIRLMIR